MNMYVTVRNIHGLRVSAHTENKITASGDVLTIRHLYTVVMPETGQPVYLCQPNGTRVMKLKWNEETSMIVSLPVEED